MTEVPKIVHHRLRAAALRPQAREAHPELDLLTAFAEQSLSQAERESVLGHLALCADCRSVLTLALPAEPVTETAVEIEAVEAATESVLSRDMQRVGSGRANRSWFAWPTLTWAALAAGVVAAVLIIRPGLDHRNNAKNSPSAPVNQTDAAANPVPVAEPTAPTAQAPAGAASSGLPAESSLHAKAKEAGGSPKKFAFQSQPLQSRERTGAVPTPSLNNQALMARNPRQPSSAAAQLAPLPMPSGASAASTPRSTNEVIEASGATTEVATASSQVGLMVQNQPPPIERAKPALEAAPAVEEKQTEAADMATLKTSQSNLPLVGRNATSLTTVSQEPAWKIAGGVLQRSIDGGASWRAALRADQAILCYSFHGQEVWAGGKQGTLSHSVDSGTTWNPVQVSYQGQTLLSDIRLINTGNPPEVILTTANNETWSTRDGGKTWVKK